MMRGERSGEGGIRTHEQASPLLVFETSPFNRSGTSPGGTGQRQYARDLGVGQFRRTCNPGAKSATRRSLKTAGFPINGDLLLHDLVDDDFEVGPTIALNERTGSVNELAKATLDQGGQLETAAELLDDFIALQCVNHEQAPIGKTECAWTVHEGHRPIASRAV